MSVHTSPKCIYHSAMANKPAAAKPILKPYSSRAPTFCVADAVGVECDDDDDDDVIVDEEEWTFVVVVDVSEEPMELETTEGVVVDEAHDTAEGTVTPPVKQIWSAKVMVAVEQSQTLAFLRYRLRAILTVLVLRRAGLGNAAGQLGDPGGTITDTRNVEKVAA